MGLMSKFNLVLAMWVFATWVCGSVAHARIFNFKDTWVSAYVRGTGGLSNVGNDLFADTSGSSTRFKDEVDYNFSGELGFAFQLGDRLVFRAGVEGLQTKLVDAIGRNTSQVKIMDVESKATTFNPNGTIEIGFRNTGTSRFFAFAGAGYSTVKVTNDYSNVSAYGSAATFKETWAANVISYQGGVGWEAFIFDNVTFSVDAGWRQLDVTSLNYDSSATVIRGGATTSVTKGSKVTNNSGNVVNFDFGGYFVGVMFKFYIPPLK